MRLPPIPETDLERRAREAGAMADFWCEECEAWTAEYPCPGCGNDFMETKGPEMPETFYPWGG